jgi:hypothetical protein
MADGIGSPLALLQEPDSARDVLLLSFNANLGFFERFALAAARIRQALVTVVGDAGAVYSDPMQVRYAGTTYLDGRALCRHGGLFHPKVVAVTSEESATLAIGSGNLTWAAGTRTPRCGPSCAGTPRGHPPRLDS